MGAKKRNRLIAMEAGNGKMMIFIGILILLQVFLFVLGCFQVNTNKKESLIYYLGWFNIIANSIFGSFNIYQLFNFMVA